MNKLFSYFIVLSFIVGSLSSAQAEGQKNRKMLKKHSSETIEESSRGNHSGEGHEGQKSFSRPYGMAGCGLGVAVVGKRGNQIFAATTNGVFYNQLFGISTGTLECQDSATSDMASSVDHYIHANRAAIESDIARGQGETLGGLHQMMKCQGQPQAFSQTLKSHYSAIFSDQAAPANEITDHIITVILNNEQLASTCHVS